MTKVNVMKMNHLNPLSSRNEEFWGESTVYQASRTEQEIWQAEKEVKLSDRIWFTSAILSIH